MQSRLLILPLLASLAALGACQGDNPYRASSLPYPPQPATAANPGPIPAPIRRRRATTPATVAGAWPPPGSAAFPRAWTTTSCATPSASRLDQRGLRPARPGSAADLQVSAFLRNELRTRQVTDYYGGYYGNYGGWRDPWYGYGASYPVTRSYTVQVTVVRVEPERRPQRPAGGATAPSSTPATPPANRPRPCAKR